MSLTNNSNGDLIDHGSVTPQESGGFIAWIRIAVGSTRRQSVLHCLGGSDLQVTLRMDLTGSGQPVEVFRGGTAYWEAGARTDASNFSAFGTGKFLALCFGYGGASPAEILLGDETTSMAAPGAYEFQNTGSGADTSSGTLRVANNFNTSRWLDNTIAPYAWWNGTRPTALEFEAWRKDPWGYRAERGSLFPPPTLFCRPGRNGATTVIDEIGGNHGTATGMTSPDLLPVQFYPSVLRPGHVDRRPRFFCVRR